MDKNFEIRNHYTEETFIEFADFHCNTVQGIVYLRYVGLIVISMTIWFWLNAEALTLSQMLLNPSILFSCIFIYMSYRIPMMMAKRLHKNCRENGAFENTIIFYEDKVVFQVKQAEEAYFYKMLYRCYESEKYFYIYTKRGVAQIIDKQDFMVGDPLELRAFLKTVDVKFHQKCQ